MHNDAGHLRCEGAVALANDLLCCPRVTCTEGSRAEIWVRQKARAEKDDKLMRTKAHVSL